MSDYDLGKKVFFLYPPSVVKDELIQRLLTQEYEVYMLKEIAMTERLLAKYPDSIVFVNIDADLAETEWETWILKIRETIPGVGIGILSYNADERLQKKYLMDIGIQCGFIKLKLGLEQSTQILLATLQANEAKGRRKFVRANCQHDSMCTLNFVEGPFKGNGTILDISVVGFSCILDPDPSFKKNSILHDIQLRLRSSLVHVQAVIFGSREEDGKTVYVMLLPPKIDQLVREKIRTYIQGALQSEIEIEGMPLKQD